MRQQFESAPDYFVLFLRCFKNDRQKLCLGKCYFSGKYMDDDWKKQIRANIDKNSHGLFLLKSEQNRPSLRPSHLNTPAVHPMSNALHHAATSPQTVQHRHYTTVQRATPEDPMHTFHQKKGIRTHGNRRDVIFSTNVTTNSIRAHRNRRTPDAVDRINQAVTAQNDFPDHPSHPFRKEMQLRNIPSFVPPRQ